MANFITGNTGISTAEHLDFRVYDPSTGGYEDPSAFTSYLTVGDNKDPFDFEITSGYQPDGRIHPVTGKLKPHDGIDYGTPSGTSLNVNGKLLSTWNDEGGGGIMSQYLIDTDKGPREILLLHGSEDNAVTGTGAITDYDIDDLPTPTATKTRGKAKEKAQAYKDMSKSEMNAAYDAMRSDPVKAKEEGMKMHKAFFNKP